MSSQFYKRYVPPAKVPKPESQILKDSALKPPKGSHHSSKRKYQDLEPKVKSVKKQKSNKNLPKQPLTEPEKIDDSPRVSVPAPEKAEGSLKADIPQAETDHAVEKHGLTPLPQPAQAEEGPQVSTSSALPEWMRAPTIARASVAHPFEQFGNEGSMGGKVVSNLLKGGISDANGLQTAILPMLLAGHQGPERYVGDICISAATGSGKTLAYALPMVETLRSKAVTRLRGLIIVPTRELVTQARDTLEMCSAGTGLKIGTAVGNRNFKDEQTLLIQKSQRWDPRAYKAEQERVVHEDEELMNWDFDAILGPQDDFECLPDHILEYSSKVDVLICTPGRLVEHIKSTKGFNIHDVRWLIIDEADRLLDESFQDWVDIVIPRLEYLPPLDLLERQFYKTFHMPRQRDVRKVVLSATMTRDVSKLMSLRLKQPRLVVLEGYGKMADIDSMEGANSHQEERIELPQGLQEAAVAVVQAEDKPLYLLHLLKRACLTKAEQQPNDDGNLDGDSMMKDLVEPTDELRSNGEHLSSDHSLISSGRFVLEKKARLLGTLIFANSNESALRLARLLAILLPKQKIKALTKSPGGKVGRKTLKMFHKRQLSVIVATDLASRGLDIPDLAHVINYDMPSSLKKYVHRVGRTARSGKDGRATTLVEHKQAKWFWNDIVRADNVIRFQKVAREDTGLQVEEQERKQYQDALNVLEQEAMGTKIGKEDEEDPAS